MIAASQRCRTDREPWQHNAVTPPQPPGSGRGVLVALAVSSLFWVMAWEAFTYLR